jgi:OmpA family protein
MRQHRFKLSAPSSTVVSVPVMIMLIAIPYFALATESHDIRVYSVEGHSQAQQDRDRYECHSCAVGQAEFDTSETVAQAPVYTPVPTTPYHPPQRHVARGAARGAAVGAVGGAITGDAGKGAAAGAAMGGTAGAFRRRDERKRQSTQQQNMRY